jgi:myo-inositol-1(or 4)-monophosphatase
MLMKLLHATLIPLSLHAARAFTLSPNYVARFGRTSKTVRKTVGFLASSSSSAQLSALSSISSRRNLDHAVTFSQYAARQAGDIMLQTAGKIAVKGTKSNAKDLVTESDIACQELIQKLLKKGFPDDFFLGEENVDAGSDASQEALSKALLLGSDSTNNDDGEDDRLLFIVDPIDGTTNFQAGLPIFCVSIGVVHLATQEVVAGVIYNPALNEMTTAIIGEGAYLNGKKLELSNSTTQDEGEEQLKLAQSLVNVGFPVVKESTLNISCKTVAALATRVRGLRMMACASQVMAWVAHDTFQVYTSWDLNAWDVAAGICIVREAGGCVMDFNGNDASLVGSRDLIITSPTGGRVLGQELRQIMEETGCLEYE